MTGKWPGQLSTSSGCGIPAALPANTAALLKLRPGDVLRVQDQHTGAHLTFILTGLYAERQSPGSAASYWQLNSIPASGLSSASGFTTYGPLVVSPSVFPGRLAEGTGTWVAQPDMADFNASDLSASSADLRTIGATWSLLSTLTLGMRDRVRLEAEPDHIGVWPDRPGSPAGPSPDIPPAKGGDA
ncbi:MAG TPA: hypothetical protein VI365_19615 [Trebonia sp.]